MSRKARVALGFALIVFGNSAFLWADGLLLAVLLLAPVGILVAAWPERGKGRAT